MTEPEMSEADNPGEYGLVMPFVVCKDQGGPYDADAFVAGYEAGSLDALLRAARPFGATVERYVPSPLVPQLDLIAMQHEYAMTSEPWDDHPEEWTLVRFALPEPLEET